MHAEGPTRGQLRWPTVAERVGNASCLVEWVTCSEMPENRRQNGKLRERNMSISPGSHTVCQGPFQAILLLNCHPDDGPVRRCHHHHFPGKDPEALPPANSKGARVGGQAASSPRLTHAASHRPLTGQEMQPSPAILGGKQTGPMPYCF